MQNRAYVTERGGLAVTVAEFLAYRNVLLVCRERFLEPVCLVQGNTEVVERRALAVFVIDLLVQAGCVLVRCDRLIQPAYPPHAQAQVV